MKKDTNNQVNILKATFSWTQPLEEISSSAQQKKGLLS